jgi:hypothetical protein
MSCPTSDRQFPMDEPHPYREAHKWAEQRRYLGLEALARPRAVLTATTEPKEDTPTLIGALSA